MYYPKATFILQLLQHVNRLKIHGRKHDLKILKSLLGFLLIFLLGGVTPALIAAFLTTSAPGTGPLWFLIATTNSMN